MSGWHFEYSLELDEKNSVIYQKIYGVWREATARSFHEDFMKEVEPIIDRPWVKMSDLTGWKTASPDVVDIIGEHQTWCREHNMIALINVIDNPITHGQLMRMLTKGGTKDIARMVRTRKEAHAVLKELGFASLDEPTALF